MTDGEFIEAMTFSDTVEQQAARIAELEAQLAAANEEKRNLVRAVKKTTKWKVEVSERAEKLAAAIAGNDYGILALEAVAEENAALKQQLAAAQERERGLEELLRRYRYTDGPRYSGGCCISCGQAHYSGCSADCDIDAALAAAQKGSE